jgi:hypothetical protein
MKTSFLKQNFYAITVLSLLLLSSALAASDPAVLEETDGFYDTLIHYTVTNPADSSIGDVVGFVIEVDYSFYLNAGTTNGWKAQGYTNTSLNAANWDSYMKADGSGNSALTWQQFFGGIDYPFGQTKSIGFFVNYSAVAADTYKFDWSDPGHLPILPGETLAGFYAWEDTTASQYLLAYIGDAQNDTFSNNGLPPFRGDTVPEPATMSLLAVGGLAMLRRRRA